MGLSRTIYTSWSGLANHQKRLDNLSNNLANVNTVGFKKTEHLFTPLFSQIISGASEATGTHGSRNGISIGAGTTTSSITSNYTQGPLRQTGNSLDLALNGNGFFMTRREDGVALTRDGSFYLDPAQAPNKRILRMGDGLPVLGWNANNGNINNLSAPSDIELPAIGDMLPGQVTSNTKMTGNIPSNTNSNAFVGSSSRKVEVKGNLLENNSTISMTLYQPVTQYKETANGVKSDVQNNVIQPISVNVVFKGPTISPSGDYNVWDWEMYTDNWPTADSPALRIYPPENMDNNSFTPGKIKFYNNSNVDKKQARGMLASSDEIKPGSSKIDTKTLLPDGSELTSSFVIGSNFTFDISRLTSVANAPAGNLSLWNVDGSAKGSFSTNVKVYDELTKFDPILDQNNRAIDYQPVRRVEEKYVTLDFTKRIANNNGTIWDWQAASGEKGEIVFNTFGDVVSYTNTGGKVNFDFSEISQLNYAGNLNVDHEDGYIDGYLQSFSVDQFGRISGRYTNGIDEVLAQVAVATVPNVTGLYPSGQNLFFPSPSSGNIMIGIAGDSQYRDGIGGRPPIGAGFISSGFLEDSNVELAKEFGIMITTERGYQANGKALVTSDEMLKELLSMKR